MRPLPASPGGTREAAAIVSLLYVTEDGASADIAVVGNDGMVGISLFMGGDATPSRAIVQSAGLSCRLCASLLKQAYHCYGPAMHLLRRYTRALITQMAQTAVCDRHHSVDQQLCRWLLLGLDRLPSIEIAMTQELIARMLGVRREGVTEAAGRLQAAGLIPYSRGHIRVLDRAGLEARVCECYHVVQRESERLLARHEAGKGHQRPSRATARSGGRCVRQRTDAPPAGAQSRPLDPDSPGRERAPMDVQRARGAT